MPDEKSKRAVDEKRKFIAKKAESLRVELTPTYDFRLLLSLLQQHLCFRPYLTNKIQSPQAKVAFIVFLNNKKSLLGEGIFYFVAI